MRTKNIFVDTETFVSNNFFHGKNLERLKEFGSSSFVKLYLTEITINEIQSNIQEELFRAKQIINQFKKDLSNKGRILKHKEDFRKYLEIPNIELDFDFDELKSSLESFIKEGNVQIIPFEKADLKVIIENYFARKKPFGPDKKKYEFPDAIVLSALENWCIQNETSIYVISADSDMAEYESEFLHPIDNLKVMLDLIITEERKDFRHDRLIEQFENDWNQITELIKERFEEKMVDDLDYDSRITSIKVIEIIQHQPYVVQDNDEANEVIIQLDVDIFFEATLEYEDFSVAYYGGEDNQYLYPERNIRDIQMSVTETAEISMILESPELLGKEDNEVSYNCIYVSVPYSDEIFERLNR